MTAVRRESERRECEFTRCRGEVVVGTTGACVLQCLLYTQMYSISASSFTDPDRPPNHRRSGMGARDKL